MIEYTDHPLDNLALTVAEAMLKGGKCYLKFTCAYCRSRQTIDEANKLYTQGKCEECGTVTDIQKRGGNLLIILPVR
jgi:PHP family Zn ribbon phosphoesterase